MTAKRTPNELQTIQLAGTSCNQLMKIVTGDTIIRNNGEANRKLIIDEVNRRLVKPLGDYMMTPYTDNRIAEIWTSMACSHPHYWVESDGNGQWIFKNGGHAKMENYFQNSPRNFGFESADDLLDLLDLFTDPFVPKQEQKPDPEPEANLALSDVSFKDTLVKMIENSEAHTKRLKAILEEYYPEE